MEEARSNEVARLLVDLLEKTEVCVPEGMVVTGEELNALNRSLGVIGYRAHRWFDGRHLVLCHLEEPALATPKDLSDQISLLIRRLVSAGGKISLDELDLAGAGRPLKDALGYLVERKWLVAGEGEVAFGKRFIIEKADVLLETGIFRRCEACNIVMASGGTADMHALCRKRIAGPQLPGSSLA